MPKHTCAPPNTLASGVSTQVKTLPKMPTWVLSYSGSYGAAWHRWSAVVPNCEMVTSTCCFFCCHCCKSLCDNVWPVGCIAPIWHPLAVLTAVPAVAMPDILQSPCLLHLRELLRELDFVLMVFVKPFHVGPRQQSCHHHRHHRQQHVHSNKFTYLWRPSGQKFKLLCTTRCLATSSF